MASRTKLPAGLLLDLSLMRKLSMTQSATASPMIPTFVKVRDHRVETSDVFTIRLDPPKGYRFKPGQFNMLYAFGVGEAAISMSGDPEETGDIVHTIRSVGSVTHVLSKLRPGDQIGVRGPIGSSWPVEEARGNDVVIVVVALDWHHFDPSFIIFFAIALICLGKSRFCSVHAALAIYRS